MTQPPFAAHRPFKDQLTLRGVGPSHDEVAADCCIRITLEPLTALAEAMALPPPRRWAD